MWLFKWLDTHLNSIKCHFSVSTLSMINLEKFMHTFYDLTMIKKSERRRNFYKNILWICAVINYMQIYVKNCKKW